MYVVSQFHDDILRHTVINKGKEYYHIGSNENPIIGSRRVTSVSLKKSISDTLIAKILADETPHIPLEILIPPEYHELFITGTNIDTNLDTIQSILDGDNETFNYMLNSNYA